MKVLLVDKVIGAVQTTVSVSMIRGVLCRVEVTVEDYLHGFLYCSLMQLNVVNGGTFG